MKVIRREYSPIKDCKNFFSWLWFTANYPYGWYAHNDFRSAGSSVRVLIRRRFGFSTDLVYDTEELNTWTYLFLHLLAFISFMVLACEITVLVMFTFVK